MYTSATDFVTCGFQGVQLNIEIMDDDPKPGFDDFVDALLINHDLPIGQQSPTQTHNGVFGFVMMDLSIMVRCIDNFQGPDCSQCMPGFAGAMCDVRINGTECTSLCTGHGQCVDGVPSLICDCDPGFTGAICEHIDDCIGVNCSENGQCVDGESSYTCDCDPGFTGVDCDMNIDDCEGVSCHENGQCVDGVASYTCDCDPDFTGVECETNIDDCVGVDCSGNGVCLDGVNSFICQCSPGFGGERCSQRMLQPYKTNHEI